MGACPGASISPGTRLQLWDCLGDAQQQWLLNGRQLQVYADKCLDAVNGGTTLGTPVQIWYCLGDPQQQWSWGSDGTIRSLSSGLCLDTVYEGTADGAPLQLSTCTGARAQVWSRRTAPAPLPAPTASPPPSPAPAATQIPIPTVSRALKVRMVLTWTWRGDTTWLQKASVGPLPGRTRLSLRCSGRGCPGQTALTARGARAVRRLLRKLPGRRYRGGDVLAVTLSAAGYLPERAEVRIRRGHKPRVT